VSPAGWPLLVQKRLTASSSNQDDNAGRPAAMLGEAAATGGPPVVLSLVDLADPGFPSFLVVSALHLDIFSTLFPGELFVNQGRPGLQQTKVLLSSAFCLLTACCILFSCAEKFTGCACLAATCATSAAFGSMKG
jgi:hypothetical protein